MTVVMNLEVAFYDPNEVSVFLESSLAGEEEERAETVLLALYATRQLSGLGRSDDVGPSLGAVLASATEENPSAWAVDALDEVKVVRASGRRGRKGFNATLALEPFEFNLHAYGFGLLGRGTGYYSPTSTLALLSHLLDRNKEQPNQQRRLVRVANYVGAAGQYGDVSVTNQGDVAAAAVGAAWSQLRQEPGVVDVNNIIAQLQEITAQVSASASPGGRMIVPEWLAWQVVKSTIAFEAGIADEAVSAAREKMEATESGTLEFEHARMRYDEQLDRVLRANSLENEVERVHAALFTDASDG